MQLRHRTQNTDTEAMKTTIKSKVEASVEALREMNHSQLFSWSRDNGLDSRAGFSAFKKALLSIGIDYAALRQSKIEAKEEALTAACTHKIVLFSDAKASHDRFGICDDNGAVLWYGRFFADDRDGYNGEQSSGELSAALKAIWLARQIANAAGARAAKLTLIVDANWLCTLSGKAQALAIAARKANLDLAMEWIRGTENPADEWTTVGGFKKWSDNDLAASATPLSTQANNHDTPAPALAAAAVAIGAAVVQLTFDFLA